MGVGCVSGLGLENEVMTHFVNGVDQIVQCPPHREGFERPLVEGDYASGDASRLGALIPSCNHDETNDDMYIEDVSGAFTLLSFDNDLCYSSSRGALRGGHIVYLFRPLDQLSPSNMIFCHSHPLSAVHPCLFKISRNTVSPS